MILCSQGMAAVRLTGYGAAGDRRLAQLGHSCHIEKDSLTATRLAQNSCHSSIPRAWQLFDWVRGLPEDHALARFCDADSYTTMIALCGPWQQLRRALQLIADMRTQGIECGVQVTWGTAYCTSILVAFLMLAAVLPLAVCCS